MGFDADLAQFGAPGDVGFFGKQSRLAMKSHLFRKVIRGIFPGPKCQRKSLAFRTRKAA
jgi:hypothetical protein